VAEHLITTGGRTFRVSTTGEDSDDIDAYLIWLCENRGQPATIAALSRQQVAAQIGRRTIPADFPEADVVIGDDGRQGGGRTRGWLQETVQAWQEGQAAEPGHAEAADGDIGQPTTGSAPANSDSAAGDDTTTSWASMQRQWTGAETGADHMVAILSSRGAITPSGIPLTRGPLPSAADLARFVWHRWPARPAAKGSKGPGAIPQIWITAPALQAVGMTPPKNALERSDDLSPVLGKLFDCQITSARAGWFTAAFRSPTGDAESRRVHLVLLPFLWLDAADQRPKDEGLAGTRGTETELPDDEDQAVELLGRRIAWLTGISEGVLPAARPASIGAALLDAVRRRGRVTRRLEACPVPDTVDAETARLDPNLESWKNMPHSAKGDSVDVEVDQRAAYLASAGQVELGYGVPQEVAKPDPAVFEERPPFGLWRVTTPPANGLDGLSTALPLPHEHMSWDEPRTFWATTRAVEQLLAPAREGGAGIGVSELALSGAWVWPQHSRLLRGWADILRAKLAEATGEGRKDYEDLIKNIYKAFIGRMASSQWPPGQRHYQQPVWVATIHADTRARAMRYAAGIAEAHGLYPIAARDIDTFIYRLDAKLDPAALLEEKTSGNGKYRIKKIRTSED
jgi:hypothetical protein